MADISVLIWGVSVLCSLNPFAYLQLQQCNCSLASITYFCWEGGRAERERGVSAPRLDAVVIWMVIIDVELLSALIPRRMHCSGWL